MQDLFTTIVAEMVASKRFGKGLISSGRISTQNTLSFGTLQEVRSEVIDRIRVLGKNDGYIISPSHEVTSDCKSENFLMLVSMLDKYKRGEISPFRVY